MGNLETLVTWTLGIAFLLYIALTNCCTDTANLEAYKGNETTINNSLDTYVVESFMWASNKSTKNRKALEVNSAEVQINAMALEVETTEVEEADTSIVETADTTSFETVAEDEEE